MLHGRCGIIDAQGCALAGVRFVRGDCRRHCAFADSIGHGAGGVDLIREKWRLPPIKLPLGLFLLGTLIAIAFSGNPAAGWPQIKKIYVFTQLLIVFSLLRNMAMIRWLFLSWAAFGSVSAGLSFVQFARKVQQAHAAGSDIYNFYVGERITGFMSHWYTFSAEEMFVLIMLASFLFFAPEARKRMWLWIVVAAVSSLGLLLAETRGVWIATAVAGLYLLWFWRRWLVMVMPVVVVAGLSAVAQCDSRALHFYPAAQQFGFERFPQGGLAHRVCR